MAYGTPRQADEIEPYYTDIRRGRPPTPELLADLVRRYEAIGGLSPLAQRTEAQRAALQRALDAVEPGRYEVALGLKHAAPTHRGRPAGADPELGAGVEEVVGLVLAPHYSAFSVGQYLERAEAAGAAEGVPVAGIAQLAPGAGLPGVPGRRGAPPAGRPADRDDRPLHRPQPPGAHPRHG